MQKKPTPGDDAKPKRRARLPAPCAVIELGSEPVDVQISLTILAAGSAGRLRVLAHVGPPKVRRRKS